MSDNAERQERAALVARSGLPEEAVATLINAGMVPVEGASGISWVKADKMPDRQPYLSNTAHVPLADPALHVRSARAEFIVTLTTSEPPPDWAVKIEDRLRKEIRMRFGETAEVRLNVVGEVLTLHPHRDADSPHVVADASMGR